jgi:hypothetical protein
MRVHHRRPLSCACGTADGAGACEQGTGLEAASIRIGGSVAAARAKSGIAHERLSEQADQSFVNDIISTDIRLGRKIVVRFQQIDSLLHESQLGM